MKIQSLYEFVAIALAVVLLSSCGLITEKVLPRVGNDLSETSALAEKYNRPDVKLCTDWMLAKLNALNSSDSRLQQLLAEKPQGLMAKALIADLIREEINRQKGAIDSHAFQQDFQKHCNAVSGAIMFDVLQDARKIGSRGN